MVGKIYKVTNLVNGKLYIGQTIQSISDRWQSHCKINGLTEQEKKMHLKRAIMKYGKENFKIEVIEECDSSELDNKEKYYISYYDSYNTGYNSTIGGRDGGGHSKIKNEKAEIIIELYTYGFSFREIAKEFNVDKNTIKGVLTRNNVQLRETKDFKFTSEIRNNIVRDCGSMTRKEVMKKYNISKSYLSQLLSGNRRI